MTQLLIINYHRILSAGETVPNRFRDFTLDKEKFEEQLFWIKKAGTDVVDLNDFEFCKNHQFFLALTFDDGKKSDVEHVLPLLQQYEFKASFFPVVNLIGTEDCLTWNELKYISQCGFSIGSHSMNHPSLTKLTASELQSELVQSKKILEEKTGKPIKQFSIPYGIYNQHIIKTVKESGYGIALTTRFRINHPGDISLMHRCNIRRSTSFSTFKKLINRNIATTRYLQMSSIFKYMLHQFIS